MSEHYSIYNILKQSLVKSLLISSFIGILSICTYSFYHQNQRSKQIERDISYQINTKNADLVTAFMLGNFEGLEAIIAHAFLNRPVDCWAFVYMDSKKAIGTCANKKIDGFRKLNIVSGGLTVGDLFYKIGNSFDFGVLFFRGILIFFSIVFTISVTSFIVLRNIRKQILSCPCLLVS